MKAQSQRWSKKHKVLFALALLLLLPFLSLEATYQLCAWRLPKPYTPSSIQLPPKVRHAIWASLGGSGEIKVKPYYSWDILFNLARFMWDSAFASTEQFTKRQKVSGGYALSSFASRRHTSKLLAKSSKRAWSWHLSWIVMTIWVGRNWSENQVFNSAARQFGFGRGILGIRSASKEFYGKKLESVTADEVAYLMAVTANPRRYLGCRNRKRALKSRAVILQVMHKNGGLSKVEVEKSLRKRISLVSKYGNCEKQKP